MIDYRIDYRNWRVDLVDEVGTPWEATKGNTTISCETLGHIKARIDRIEAARAAS